MGRSKLLRCNFCSVLFGFVSHCQGAPVVAREPVWCRKSMFLSWNVIYFRCLQKSPSEHGNVEAAWRSFLVRELVTCSEKDIHTHFQMETPILTWSRLWTKSQTFFFIFIMWRETFFCLLFFDKANFSRTSSKKILPFAIEWCYAGEQITFALQVTLTNITNNIDICIQAWLRVYVQSNVKQLSAKQTNLSLYNTVVLSSATLSQIRYKNLCIKLSLRLWLSFEFLRTNFNH